MDTYIKSVRVDKLAFVMDLDELTQYNLILKLRAQHAQKTAFYQNMDGYKYGVKLPIRGSNGPNKEYMFIHTAPYKTKKGEVKHQTRIEFIPSRFNEEGLVELVGRIEELIEVKYSDFVEQAFVTAIDIAIDIANLTPDDVLFSYPSKLKWRTFGKGNSIETVEIGHRRHTERFRIYNKSLEMHEKRKPGAKAMDEDVLRVERCLKPHILLRKLPSLMERTPPVTMYSIKMIKEQGQVPLCFLDSCRIRTIPGALSLLDKDTQKLYGQCLRSCRLDCFDKKLLKKLFWEHLEELSPLRPGKLSDVDGASPQLGTILDGKGTLAF